MKKYDSTKDTLDYIKIVRKYLDQCADILIERGAVHDASKLLEPEKLLFDKYRPLLAKFSYGSDEYAQGLRDLKPALDHHYAVNSHHPEHFTYFECGGCFKEFPDEWAVGFDAAMGDWAGKCDHCGYDVYQQKRGVTGISGMDLFDVLEMLFDWKAASEHQFDGTMAQSIMLGLNRFKIEPQLFDIMVNTCVSMGFFPRDAVITRAFPSGEASTSFVALKSG